LIPGFEHPFERELNPDNRWVVLANLIPWDEICGIYHKQTGVSSTGRPGLSPRVAIGALIIKYLLNLDDRETVEQISENLYMQYFLGYPSFTCERPFDASLFVELRKRLGIDAINTINERIVSLRTRLLEDEQSKNSDENDNTPAGLEQTTDNCPKKEECEQETEKVENRGRILFDATACPQDIAYPTDLTLLSDAREVSERLIDQLYCPALHGTKPRTYRKVARKKYLKTAQKKNKTRKEIRNAALY